MRAAATEWAEIQRLVVPSLTPVTWVHQNRAKLYTCSCDLTALGKIAIFLRCQDARYLCDRKSLGEKWSPLRKFLAIPRLRRSIASEWQCALLMHSQWLGSQNSLERTLAPSSFILASVRSEFGACRPTTQKHLHSKPSNLLVVCGLTCWLHWLSYQARQAHWKLQSVSRACLRTCLEGFGDPRCTPEFHLGSSEPNFMFNPSCEQWHLFASKITEMHHSCLKHLKNKIHACKTR